MIHDSHNHNRRWSTALGTILFSPLILSGLFNSEYIVASEIKISKSAFVFNGKRYFRAGSEDLELVSFGHKESPVTQANYLAKEGTVSSRNLGKIKVDVRGPFDIQWDKYSKTDINAGIKYLKAVGGTGAFSREAAKNAQLKLVKLSLSEGALKKLLNQHANRARTYLDAEGRDGRVVSAVFVVMEARLASTLSNAGSVSVSVPVGSSGFDIEVAASAASKSSSTVNIPEDTTFAYLLHKVKKWEKVNGQRRIKAMVDDQQGLN